MARAYRGVYARKSSYQVPYKRAEVWGTGVNAIHSYYGEGPPLRVVGRRGHLGSSPVAGLSPRDRDYQAPADSSGMDYPQELTWGYPVDLEDGPDYSPDSFGMGADAPIHAGDVGPSITQYMDDRPVWGDDTPDTMIRADASTMTPWGTPGGVWMRALREGSHRYRTNPDQRLPGQADPYRPVSAEPSISNPTETVSEGWLNKETSFVAYAYPSDPKQYEIQTSMAQRFLTQDNRRAQMRATDDARSPIASRVMAMVEKVYSTGERLYDMFPYQIDQIERPFSYRTAGVGPADWMVTNEVWPQMPIRRTPPPDPAMGVPESGPAPETFGYTAEDTMYYG